MKHKVTPEFLSAFTRRISGLGFTTKQEAGENTLLSVFKDGQEVCKIDHDGNMRFLPETSPEQERNKIYRTLTAMKQAHDLYTDAPQLQADGVSDFRLISNFGDYILAAKMTKDNEVRFTTWQYDYDRTGVMWGHYFETNYEGAKQDFAVRSGLIEEQKLFSEEELVVLHDTCVFRGRNDDSISYEDEKMLHSVMEKVESNIPNLIFEYEQVPMPEHEDEYGI
ncbi:hypothetical protein [Sinanaerobacter sp. ZZT-01]|uniref:hypothetical protein n=1 Tax=Sinanaerobacter sp. ZZT-01 TaxID=3111540 RepID=UPI002D778535|nr:hypothetical protein [Sinanaerobacter sp. ZZT-01]WRR93948.1 hypothetical protein U5921_02155 [Sinanaerobacter sp. ZZT-01]